MEFFTTPNSKTVIATLVTIERSELTFLLILMKKVTICNLYLASFYFLILLLLFTRSKSKWSSLLLTHSINFQGEASFTFYNFYIKKTIQK